MGGGYRAPGWGDENVLELRGGWSHNRGDILNASELYANFKMLKMINFVLCKLYPPYTHTHQVD